MNVKNEEQFLSIRELTAGGMFATLIAVGAFIKITLPTAPVPMHFTLQWFFVLLAGLMLNKRLAGTCVGVYLLAGLVGMPIFAGGGGPSYLLRPTFGYLLGFAAASYIMAWICEWFRTPGFKRLLLISVCGLLVYYSVGMAYYYAVCRFLIFQEVTWRILLVNGFLLTVWADSILCVLAAETAVKLRGAVRYYIEK